MNQKEKACSALTAVFPYPKYITDFIKDCQNRNRLQSFVDFAAGCGLIDSPTLDTFRIFVNDNSRPQQNDELEELTIEELIDNKKEYLNIRLSNSALIDKINNLLSKNHIKLPPLSSAMFTRLKRHTADTPRRRDALRSFAFWIGYERGDIGEIWHYETLKHLCHESGSTTNASSCGIRMAFSINSRGNIIGQDIISWMKRTIRNTLNARSEHFPGKSPPKIKNYTLTTFQLDMPLSEQSTIPSAYANMLKQAITIAYEVEIQWIMSGFANGNSFFSIGIAAGHFDEMGNRLQAILNAKLSQDPVIRLTEFARQCVEINHIKATMNKTPYEIELFNGETYKVWWITELSGIIYWDLVPGIVSQKCLTKTSFNSLTLKQKIIIPNEAQLEQESNAINFFFRFPHHPKLGFEIVRTLICKKKFSESLEIINALLRITPYHLNSRIMKMMLYKYLGLEAPNYYTSNMLFDMAEKEAAYIMERLDPAGVDFYSEYALLKLARFSTAVKALRQQDEPILKVMDLRLGVPDLIAFVKQAEDILMWGITVSSPTVERILFLFLSVQTLKYILYESVKGDGSLSSRLTCPNDKIKEYTLNIIISLYQQVLSIDSADFNGAMQLIDKVIDFNKDIVALDAFIPSNSFYISVFYWDLLPVRNVGVVKETLKILKGAIVAVKTRAFADEPVYSLANLSGQFVSASQFILQIDSIIKEIEKRYSTEAELERMDPVAVIGRPDDDLVLMTYHV